MAAQDKELKKQAAVMVDYFQTFDTEAGQRILKDLEEEFDECSYEKDGPMHGTIFNEGRRDLFLQIKKNVEAGRNPEAWIKEHNVEAEEPDE